jgi:phosphoribosyl-ATP pyrophosphohydrolase/phosphoribosyl-AMP cyclohydrolase
LDTILIKAKPTGPVCHIGSDTCFEEKNEPDFLSVLEETIADRFKNPAETSYVSKLYKKGINKIAQKVGEEATELIIEAKDNNDELFLNEAADLLFHFSILVKAKGFKLKQVIEVLKSRRK